MKTVVIFAHNYQENSRANKAALEVLATQPNLEIRNVDQLYPTGQIDIQAEQAALNSADVIVFMHPVFWFNVPSSLKRWQEEVLQYGYAFGEGGDKLHGKRMIHAYTAGSSSEFYLEQGKKVVIEAVQETVANYCGMTYAGAVGSYGLSAMHPDLEGAGREHAQRLIDKLASLAK